MSHGQAGLKPCFAMKPFLLDLRASHVTSLASILYSMHLVIGGNLVV
jgi:hypothetical protein